MRIQTQRLNVTEFDGKEATRRLLGLVIRTTEQSPRVLILCPPSQGNAIMQRLRVMLSRARTEARRQGKAQKYFKLHHTVTPWTEQGKRFDALHIWRSKNDNHLLMEVAEDIGVAE